MRGQFGTDCAHHFVNARPQHQIVTDRGKKGQIHFSAFTLRDIA